MNIGGQIVPVVVNGIVDVEGMKFHDIEGGFGEGKKAILVKEIAEIHGRELRVINQNIERNRLRFKDGIDILDLKGTEFEITLSDHGIYNQNSINRSEKIYMLSERGYAKLLKILEDDVAWEQYEKLVDGYFNMRGQTLNTSELSPELQMFKQIFDTVAKQQLENKQMKEEIKETKEEIQGIRDIVAINTTNWRKDTSSLISKISLKLGGYENINLLREESYRILEERGRTRLSVKLTNKRRRMAEEGVCKSKRDKLNKLDVIADDNRLVETYIAIVKEMAIKYGISTNQ
jgi:phage protein